MAEITGGTRVPGLITPTDTNDTYAVIDPIYGIDGLRNVTSIAEMNAIPNNRRRTGMQVGVTTGGTSGGTVYFILKPEPWSATTEDWVRTFEIKSGETYYNVLHITELYGSSPIAVKDSLHMGSNVAFTSTTNVQDVFIIGNNNRTTEYFSGFTTGDTTVVLDEGFNGTDWYLDSIIPNTGWAVYEAGSPGSYNQFYSVNTTPLGGNCWLCPPAYEGDTSIEFTDFFDDVSFEYSGISTVGLQGVNVSWYGRREVGDSFPTLNFEGSTDGTNWTGVTFTDVTPNSTYQQVSLSLPSHMMGHPQLRLRFFWNAGVSFQSYTFDEFVIDAVGQPFSGVPTVGLYDDGLIVGSNNLAQAEHLSGFTIIGQNITATTSDSIYTNNDIYIKDYTLSDINTSSVNVLTLNGQDKVEYKTLYNVWEKSGGDSSARLIGGGSIATGDTAVAEGSGTTANGVASHAEGVQTTATGVASHAEGQCTTASGDFSHAEGSCTTASGDYTHAEGWKTTASCQYAHASGAGTIASAPFAHSEGNNTTASGWYSHAQGHLTTAAGNCSHAEGSSNKAIGAGSHVEGQSNEACGNQSHAEGYVTKALGCTSHSEGYYTTASGDYGAHAEGRQTTASGDYSHAQGNTTTASGDYSFAFGSNTVASDFGAVAGGSDACATNLHSWAYGSKVQATGCYSHALGEGRATGHEIEARGRASFTFYRKNVYGGKQGAFADYSAILGGTDHHINTGATKSAVLGGHNGILSDSANNSVILGGSNITAVSADTVYVPKMEVDETGEGIILKSPDGNRWKITVTNGGALNVSPA